MSARRPRRAEPLAALFATVVWAAVAFAVEGLLAVLLDRDPIESPVGRFAGITAIALTALAVWAVLALTAGRPAPWWGLLLAGIVAYLGPVVAAVPSGLALVAEQGLSPFVLAESALAAATAVALWAVLRRARIAREIDPRTREW